MALNIGNSQQNLTPTSPSQTSGFVPQNQGDQLVNLEQFGWMVGKGDNASGWLYFPVTNVATDISQDLAIHKYPDLDAARVENTGRNPITVSCTAIFVNTITPGQNESWVPGTLYPDVYQKVLNSALQRETGTLQHPFIGQFTAKLVSAHSVMNADFRGGEVVELHFIETINAENILTSIQSSAPSAISVSRNLDNELGKLTPAQIAELKRFGWNPDIMAALLLSFQIVATTSILFSNLVVAISSGNFPLPTQLVLIANSIYQTNLLVQAISAANDTRLARLNNAANVFYAQMLDFESQFNQKTSKTVKTYITNMPMTLSAIADLLSSNLTDIMTLNPKLLVFPVVPDQSKVKYYG